MRIYVDDGMASGGRQSGIGLHAVSLIASLRALTPCDVSDHSVLRYVPRLGRRVAYLGLLNLTAPFRSQEIVYYLGSYLPRVGVRGKRIFEVYDFSVIRFPETNSPVWRRFNQRALARAVRRADAVVTLSESTRAELLELFPDVRPEKVFVGRCGLREPFYAVQPGDRTVRDLSLEPFSYFLFVGDLTRRKNLALLLRAFLRAKTDGVLAAKTLLVLAGKREWGAGEFRNLLREEKGVRALGYCTDEQLVALYRYCAALVFPSVYEGFGIPLIEAMSQGAPILCSDIPTNRELHVLHGGRMRLFGATDESALVRLLSEAEGGALRDGLTYGDLGRYRYGQIAREHLSVFRALCGESNNQAGEK